MRITSTWLGVLATIVLSSPLSAVTITPVAVTASSEFSGRNAIDTINSNGLTGNLHDVDPNAMWMSSNPDAADTGGTSITWDLGLSYNLTGFHLWNYNEANLSTRGVASGDIQVSNTPNFTSGVTTLAAQSFTQAPGAAGYAGEDYSLAATGRFVRFKNTAHYPYPVGQGDQAHYIGLSEIRFEGTGGTPSPHPSERIAIDRARGATVTATTGDPSPGTILNDHINANQYDSGTGPTSAVALSFGAEQSLNKVFLYHTPDYVSKGFEVQRATVASPDVNNNAHWATLPGGSFTTQTASGQSLFTFSQSITTSGVRVLATDKSNIVDNRMRLREVMVFDRYMNAAPAATVAYTAGDSWQGPASQLNNESIADQSYFTDATGPGSIDFTWVDPQRIGGFLVVGGAGAVGEHLIDFTILADLGSGLVPIVTHTGNTEKSTYDILDSIIITDHVRVTITSGDADSLARISEVFIFVPEPHSAVLAVMALCGLATCRRRSFRLF